MKDYSIDRLRNIAFVSHSGAGKTSLAEAMLYVSKGINRLGRVDDGTSTLDYDQEEIKRQISIDLALAPVEWNEHKINILDAPGYFDFVGDMIAALRVADGAVIVVCASTGVEVGTEKAWAYAEQYNTPRVVFVNKMERENANFSRVVEQLQSMFGPKVVPVQLPIGNAQDYQGHVDLIQQKAYLWDNNEVKVADVPAEMASEVAAAREALIEAVSVTDDELMMKYLEGEALTDAEIESALAVGTKTGDVVPVFCGSATANVGITELMNYCIQCLPSPAEKVNAGIDTKTSEEVEIKPDDASLNALVFKTLADPYVGKLTLFKVLSGTIKSDSVVHNVSRGRDERIGQLFVIKEKSIFPSAIWARRHRRRCKASGDKH